MRTNTLLTAVITSLVVLAVVLGGFFLWQREARSPSETNVNSTIPEETQNVIKLLNVQPVLKPDDRIVTFGGSLISENSAVMTQQLTDGLKLKVEVVVVPGTSAEAVVEMTKLLERPPKLLILDVGRFDGGEGLDLETTKTNVSAMAKKAQELGLTMVFIGGVGSDGNTQLADLLRLALPQGMTFVDASPLLLASTSRTSSTTLNAVGTEKLAGMLVDALQPSTGS